MSSDVVQVAVNEWSGGVCMQSFDRKPRRNETASNTNVDRKLNLEVGWKTENALCGFERRQSSGGLLRTRQYNFGPQKLQ